MCFSAGVSFSVGGLLLTLGGMGLRKVKEKSQYFFASIPFFFGIQQIIEGFLWLSLEKNHSFELTQDLTQVFVLFGQSFWPIWIPLSTMELEPAGPRHRLLKNLLRLGIIMAIYLALTTFMQNPQAVILTHHVQYIFHYPEIMNSPMNLVYLLPTVVALLLSSHRQLKTLGVLLLCSFIFSQIFYSLFVFSIWCFFAAFLSFYIVFNPFPSPHEILTKEAYLPKEVL